MSAKGEEVVMNSHSIELEHLCPGVGYHFFYRRTWCHKRDRLLARGELRGINGAANSGNVDEFAGDTRNGSVSGSESYIGCGAHVLIESPDTLQVRGKLSGIRRKLKSYDLRQLGLNFTATPRVSADHREYFKRQLKFLGQLTKSARERTHACFARNEVLAPQRCVRGLIEQAIHFIFRLLAAQAKQGAVVLKLLD